MLVAVLICNLQAVHAGESNHRYKDSEEVVLWVNKVGPYNNPQVSRHGRQHTLPVPRQELLRSVVRACN